MKPESTQQSSASQFPGSTSDSPDMVWKVLLAVARHAEARNELDLAEKYLQQALAALSEAFGPDDLRVALVFLEYIDLCYLRGDIRQAKLFTHRVKRILESEFSHHHKPSGYSIRGH